MDRKPIFDLLRRALGRPFRPGEVSEIDAALDAAPSDSSGDPSGLLGADSAGNAPRPAKPVRISRAGVALIKRFEGCARKRKDGRIEAYPDPGTGGDPWTIGWGATGPGISKGTVWTQDACDARLEADLELYAAQVAAAIDGAPTTQPQFDALVSFHYNTGAITKATLTRLHRAGDFAGAEAQFARWCYAGGRVMKGLVRRRAAEAALYRSGTPSAQ